MTSLAYSTEEVHRREKRRIFVAHIEIKGIDKEQLRKGGKFLETYPRIANKGKVSSILRKINGDNEFDNKSNSLEFFSKKNTFIAQRVHF